MTLLRNCPPVRQLKVQRLEAQLDSDSADAKVRSVVKEYERKMAQLQCAHDEEAAAVREAADAELSLGRKELGDRVSYLNQELQVCRHCDGDTSET